MSYKIMAHWTITKEFRQKFSGGSRIVVEVVCTCGNTGIRRKSHVENGRTRMCKNCASKETAKNYGTPRNFKDEKELFETFYKAIQKSSSRRRIKVIFDISKEYLWNLLIEQNYKCALTGREITIYAIRGRKTASLDRIDSKKGYIEGNVQWVHKDLNRFKNNYPMNYFIQMCKEVYTHYKNKK